MNSSKKTATKGKATRKGSAKQISVHRRAEFIINEDAEVYSDATRATIKGALDNDDDLAELVRRESSRPTVDAARAIGAPISTIQTKG